MLAEKGAYKRELANPTRTRVKFTASNQPEAVGQPFYGIYEVIDLLAGSGRLSGFKPGATTFPTTFAAGNGQRLFVFGSIDAGNAGAGGAGAVAAGSGHTCALLSDGTVQCWGYNYDGQLGNGTTTESSVPVTVSGITNAIAVAGGYEYTCALLSGGSVQCWGHNGFGELGNGTTTTNSSVPVTVSGITNAIAIATGYYHTCAVLSGGTVQCWGLNGDAELGNGTTTNSSVPVSVTGITNAIAVAAGSLHTCAVLRGGSVQCWGDNIVGELGNGCTAGAGGTGGTGGTSSTGGTTGTGGTKSTVKCVRSSALDSSNYDSYGGGCKQEGFGAAGYLWGWSCQLGITPDQQGLSCTWLAYTGSDGIYCCTSQ